MPSVCFLLYIGAPLRQDNPFVVQLHTMAVSPNVVHLKYGEHRLSVRKDRQGRINIVQLAGELGLKPGSIFLNGVLEQCDAQGLTVCPVADGEDEQAPITVDGRPVAGQLCMLAKSSK